MGIVRGGRFVVAVALALALLAGLTAPADAAPSQEVGAERAAAIGGEVTLDGKGTKGVTVDLFEAGPDGSRLTWIGDTTTGGDGRYLFDVEPGCWVLTFIAPDGARFADGGRYRNAGVCVADGERSIDNDAALVSEARPAEISGAVRQDGAGRSDVVVDLFTMAADGSRSRFVGDTRTGPDGSYRFTVDAGCWVLTFIAPMGSEFANGTGFQNLPVCVKPGEKSIKNDAELIDQPGEGVDFEGPDGITVTIDADPRPTFPQLRVTPDARDALPVSDVMVSRPYELELDEGITLNSARVTLPYEPQLLDGFDPAGLRIHTFDEEYGLWVEAGSDQRVDTAAQTVSATVDHFSRFAVLALDPEGFERYWPTKPAFCVAEGGVGVDLAFTIDTSGSMSTSDPDAQRVAAALAVVDQMSVQDRAAVISFNGAATVEAPLTLLDSAADVAAVRAAIGATASFGGLTDITDAVRTTTGVFVADPIVGRPRASILLSDGQSPYDPLATDEAAAANVVYYTVGLGPGADADLLGAIAAGTGGRYVSAPDADTLIDIYEEISGGLIDDGTDSDGDGLTDCQETRGMYSTRGFGSRDAIDGGPSYDPSPRFITTDPDNPDSDFDGVSDGDEMGPALDLTTNSVVARIYRFLIDAGITVVFNPRSDPNLGNSDRDDLTDLEEFDLGTDAFEEDSDGDGMWDDDEVRALALGLDVDPLRYDDGPGGIERLRADILFVPEGFADFIWPAGVMIYDASNGRCSEGDEQQTDDPNCQLVANWSREVYVNSGRYDAAFGIINAWCILIGSCGPVDIEAEFVRHIVARQGVFNEDGSLRDQHIREYALLVCHEEAAFAEQCSLEFYDRVTFSDAIETTADLIDVAIDLLPGGRRPPDDEIDSTKSRLEQLCLDAKAAVPRGSKSPQRWGREVHSEFNRLVEAEGNARLFGETGYLNGVLQPRQGAAWPRGTSAPDAVLGSSQLMPKALYDLKTGVRGIEETWLTGVRSNLPLGFDQVPVVEIRC